MPKGNKEKMPAPLVGDWEKEFEKTLMQLSADQSVWWIATDNTQWNVTNNIDFTDKLKEFIRSLLDREFQKGAIKGQKLGKAQGKAEVVRELREKVEGLLNHFPYDQGISKVISLLDSLSEETPEI